MAKNVIITKTARKKLVQARAGIISLPKIVGMAFGSGGVNSKGEVVPPTDNQTTLTAEMYRKKSTVTAFCPTPPSATNAP